MARRRLAGPAQRFALFAAVQVAVVLLALGYGCQMVSAGRPAAEQRLASALSSTLTAKGPIVVTITEDIVLTKALPYMEGNYAILIKGACGSRKCVVDGAGRYPIFSSYGPKLTIEDLIVRNSGELAIYSKTDLKLTRVVFTGNKMGAVSVGTGGNAWDIEDCHFENNDGSALLLSTSGSGKVVRTTFRSNRAEGNGGAVVINAVAKSYVFDRVTLDSNTAGKSGGGIFIEGSYPPYPERMKVLISGCKFTKNVAKGGPGGALAVGSYVEARICGTSIAGGGNTAKGGKGNDVAVVSSDFHRLPTAVSVCPKKGLSLFVVPAPKIPMVQRPVVRENCAVC
ncbi:hypothetical protein CBR_g48444 [Chara braunii]|uniref:Right handed beta helix domain-containing protein n=1 Tax=Chara braunii TaxID=69332 RepID=A0A388M2W8_CHABU|nr:hypothetical protein CBR_g48444 [Chara braunii]|eukprot:GBG88832.1 hypothetical protein CBR_g48444 [Chara braunii]